MIVSELGWPLRTNYYNCSSAITAEDLSSRRFMRQRPRVMAQALSAVKLYDLQIIERTSIASNFHNGIAAGGEAGQAIVESDEAAQGKGWIRIGEDGGLVGGKVA